MSRWNFKAPGPNRKAGSRGRHAPGATAYRDRRSGDLVLTSVGSDAARGPVDPTRILARSIRDALDPAKVPSRVKTLSEMTPEEKAEMQRLYGGKK